MSDGIETTLVEERLCAYVEKEDEGDSFQLLYVPLLSDSQHFHIILTDEGVDRLLRTALEYASEHLEAWREYKS
jgi:hypothetical protein